LIAIYIRLTFVTILLFSLFTQAAFEQSAQLVVAQNSDTLGVYEIFELTFQYKGIFKNPWEFADIRAEFIHPASNDTLRVGGFYYRYDVWKARIVPTKVGEWFFHYQYFVHNKLIAKGSGQFTATPSDHPGYVRISADNPFRFIFDNGEPYYPLGFGSCNNFNNFGFDGPERWELKSIGKPGFPSSNSINVEPYFETFGNAGFNIYRWSNDNCSYSVYERIGIGENIYKARESILLDELIQTAVKNAFRIIFNPLNTPDLTEPRFVNDSLRVNAVKRYLKYCNDRWGAWVDIWEFFNEKSTNKQWFEILVSYMHDIDPYHHLLTSNPSYIAPNLFDLLTMHEYDNGDNSNTDRNIANKKNKTLREQQKPMVFTEFGNQRPYSNYNPQRYRVFIWTAFAEQAHLILWNNSFAKYDTGGVGQYTNVYLGPEERQETKIHTQFISHFPIKHRNVALEVSKPNKVRVHALQADDDLIAYLYCFADRPNIKSGREKDNGAILKNMTVKVPVPQNANYAIWVDPESGRVLDSFEITSGLKELNVPDFKVDIALRVSEKERLRN